MYILAKEKEKLSGDNRYLCSAGVLDIHVVVEIYGQTGLVEDDVADGTAVGHHGVVVAIVGPEEYTQTSLIMGGDVALNVAQAGRWECFEGAGRGEDVVLGTHCSCLCELWSVSVGKPLQWVQR